MTEDSRPVFNRLAEMRTELDRVERLYDLCTEVRYLPSPRPRTPDRPSGGVSRPTEDTALDHQRIAVGEELEAADRHLVSAAAYVLGVAAALERALSDWEGASGEW